MFKMGGMTGLSEYMSSLRIRSLFGDLVAWVEFFEE